MLSVVACWECSILILELVELLNCLLRSGYVTSVRQTHLPHPSSPSARPPGSRLREQLRSPPHRIQAVKGETCHPSPAVWMHSCTGSVGREKLWRKGLWAAAASSAARRVFFPSSSLNWTNSEPVSSERSFATLLCLCCHVYRMINGACAELEPAVGQW